MHRIGRTGRAGCEGEAISLVCVDEAEYLKNIEKLIKKELEKKTMDGFEPDPTIEAKPIQRGGGGGQGRSGGGRDGSSRSGNSRNSAGRDNRAPSSAGKGGYTSSKPTKPTGSRGNRGGGR